MEFLKPSLLEYPDAPSPADSSVTVDSVTSPDFTSSFPMETKT
jgi:hypothetical protein